MDAKVPPLRRKMTPEEIAAEKAHWLEVGRKLSAKYPYDDDHPPSKVWQEELYDDQGLPRRPPYTQRTHRENRRDIR